MFNLNLSSVKQMIQASSRRGRKSFLSQPFIFILHFILHSIACLALAGLIINIIIQNLTLRGFFSKFKLFSE